MSHEIKSSDSAIYRKKAAWHGLGIVTEDDLTPREAAERSGLLSWTVSKQPSGYMDSDNKFIEDEKHVCLVRSDTGEVLGRAKENYHILQNDHFINIIESLADDKQLGEEKITFDTLGSIRGGQVIYASIKLGEFSLFGDKDPNLTYAMFLNGHTGNFSYQAGANNVRIVCNNTIQVGIGDAKRKGYYVSFKHTTSLKDEVYAARDVILGQKKAHDFYREKALSLSMQHVSYSEVQEYFKSVYSSCINKYISDAMLKAEKEEENRIKLGNKKKAQDAIISIWDDNYNYHHFQEDCRGTAWGAFNSVTQWFDHEKRQRRINNESDSDMESRRSFRNLADKDHAYLKNKSLDLAMDLVKY